MISKSLQVFAISCVCAAAIAGCARGCERERPAAAPKPAAPPPPQASTPAAVEQQLGLVLPERRSSDILPGMVALPYRRLPGFEASKQLVLAYDRKGLRLLEHSVPAEQAADEAAVTELLRWGMSQWAARTGLAANRLVLAADASLQVADVARVRRLAMAANTWRVVALARDGEALVELLLDPPRDRPTKP